MGNTWVNSVNANITVEFEKWQIQEQIWAEDLFYLSFTGFYKFGLELWNLEIKCSDQIFQLLMKILEKLVHSLHSGMGKILSPPQIWL